MSLRKRDVNPKQNPDRHETDYERWLKDHADQYQPAGKPRYHPSDTDDTSEGEGVESEQNILRLQENSETTAKTKTNAPFNHAVKNVDIDEGVRVVQVSRYGSIMFPSTNYGESGHRSSIEGSRPRSSHRELGRCCVLGILLLIVLLLGIQLSMRRYRRRQRGINDMPKDRKKSEKVRSIGMFPRSTANGKLYADLIV